MLSKDLETTLWTIFEQTMEGTSEPVVSVPIPIQVVDSESSSVRHQESSHQFVSIESVDDTPVPEEAQNKVWKFLLKNRAV